jgi:2'-hydroxyisoflavone reductase
LSTTRREFVKLSAAAGGALGLGLGLGSPASALAHAAATAAIRVPAAPRALRLLILGGTGFTGPFQVQYAVARGHQVTVFNRGRRDGSLPAGVEQLLGDRNEAGGLAALQGREWDAIIDNPTTLPFWVRDAGQLLQGKARQYVFISTISTYAGNDTPGAAEDAPLAGYTGSEDPMSIRQSANALYGPLKVLSEREAEKWFPGRTTVIRPGLIVGPRDETDRFSYWPIRMQRGGEVMAPGNPTDPVQVIDARDLAEWTIRMVEQQTYGIFNATGPRSPLTIGEMLGAIRGVLPGSHDVRLTWVPAEFLAQHEVRPWGHMPVWVPPQPGSTGFAARNIAKAVAAGLTFRRLAETVRDTLAWHHTRPAERQAALSAGLPAAKEAEVLAAWHASRPARG